MGAVHRLSDWLLDHHLKIHSGPPKVIVIDMDASDAHFGAHSRRPSAAQLNGPGKPKNPGCLGQFADLDTHNRVGTTWGADGWDHP